ncbi:NmrA family NAD(P)-binding protein [Dyadobacter luticola]|uniref:NAD-dependent dehydratase n=1 Tax=Dyadobacter luticola TaxID=1979387 RepID=A0A5R9KRV3_9BACT|nr:NAD(P)H-binding protein [Dyadobacter luticola]TLU98897.1 NAD-dependent dehydratase [Dyadobacter luticola]
MKIVLTGSLGHISKPLAQELVQNEHDVTVISSNVERQEEIKTLGAKAAIGSLADTDFLTNTFTGADLVYTMVPPRDFFDPTYDMEAYYKGLGENYAQAIAASGVKKVINLSTFGAHLNKGNGILLGAHLVEQTLNALPEDVSIVHMRPTSFFYNLYAYVDMIKSGGIIAANYGGDHVIPWVAPVDIATAIAEEIETPFSGRKVRYVASEELTGNETARILGEAIGKSDLQWILIPGEQVRQHLEGVGMNKKIVAGMIEMYDALYSGLLAEDYNLNRPELGKTKLVDFAKEFAGAFQQK